MTRRFAGVVWDIDGTLVDSEPLHAAALVAVCARFGLAVDPDPEVFRGVDLHGVWERLAPHLRDRIARSDWEAQIIEHYCRHASELRPLPGAVAAVTRLAGAGVAQICASNSGRRVVAANLGALGLDRLLPDPVSLDDVPFGKPAPDPYLLAAARLGLPPAALLAVEDSRTGARSAVAAGLTVAGLPTVTPAGVIAADFGAFRLRDAGEVAGLILGM